MTLNFRFDSFQAFMWMDGHGPYVWTCYAVVMLTLVILAVEPILKRKRFIKEQRALALRQNQSQYQEHEESL